MSTNKNDALRRWSERREAETEQATEAARRHPTPFNVCMWRDSGFIGIDTEAGRARLVYGPGGWALKQELRGMTPYTITVAEGDDVERAEEVA